MRLALDAMGSDGAPAVEVAGALAALAELEPAFEILLVGDRPTLEAEVRRQADGPVPRLQIVHAPERVAMGEAPAQAIRRKPNSSVVVGLELVRQGQADAFVSAGSTGAVLAGALMLLRPLPGVDRPTVGAVLPTRSGYTLLVDAGANLNTRPHHRVQFAELGAIYAQDLMGIPEPRVGLLNVGQEPEKGDEAAVETHRLLSGRSDLRFVGNVEGRDVIHGVCDVLVADGFVGNVLLKFYEAVSEFFLNLVHEASAISRLKRAVARLMRLDAFDWTEYGGAPLLGVNGVVIICHGGSPPRAIRNAIRVAKQAVERRMVDHIRARLSAAAARMG